MADRHTALTIDRSARLSVAPMMDRTDRHYRWFFRQISQDTQLYPEMVPKGAILHGDRERHLGFSEVEHPIAFIAAKLLPICWSRPRRDDGLYPVKPQFMSKVKVSSIRIGLSLVIVPDRQPKAVPRVKTFLRNKILAMWTIRRVPACRSATFDWLVSA